MPDPQDPTALDSARRQWLAALGHAHAADPNLGNALAYARAAWMCGEYEIALGRFQWAHDSAPGDVDALLALVRAAAMLGRPDVEARAFAKAGARFPRSAALALHRALGLVPANIGVARDLLRAHPGDSLCAQFLYALAAIESGTAQPLPHRDDPVTAARDDSLRWVLRHAPSPDVHIGLPVGVLLRALDAASIQGSTLECGVYFGRSLRLIAARTASRVDGFDSFEGLPEAWNAAETAGSYNTAGRLPDMPAHVTLHAGWFDDTLPRFFASRQEPIRLLHVDCDLYSSTRTVLEHSGPRLVAGSVVVFDDLLGYPGHEQHELRAWEEFVSAHAVEWTLLAACLLGREVAIRVDSIAR